MFYKIVKADLADSWNEIASTHEQRSFVCTYLELAKVGVILVQMTRDQC